MDDITHWIPAFAGMTAGAELRLRRGCADCIAINMRGRAPLILAAIPRAPQKMLTWAEFP